MDLDRFYALLTAKTGIQRKRDRRLEAIAADRALEARFTVGTDGSMGIPHPVDQLKARTWPIQGTFKGVWENAIWHYAQWFLDDPFHNATEGWWASTAHRNNLLRTDATHWGLGVHIEPPAAGQTTPRWYGICLFTKELKMRAVVVSGENYPDALSAGPLAAKYGANIYLVRRDTLPAETRTALVNLKPSEILLIGGTGVVSSAVETELRKIAPVARVAGPNRFSTAVEVARI